MMNIDQNFNVALATEYGLLEAIIVRHLQICLTEKKARNEARGYKGHYWESMSVRTYKFFFPYAKIKDIEKAIVNLRHQGIIIDLSDESYAFVDEDKWLGGN